MARTKAQKEVLELSAALPPINPEEVEEARRRYAVIYAGKKEAWCSRCGRSWASSIWDNRRKRKEVCPHCGTSGTIKRSAGKNVHKDKYYFSLVRMSGGWQVVRSWFCEVFTRKDAPSISSWWMNETSQVWLRPESTTVWLGRKVRGSCGGPCDLWKWDTPIDLKYDHYRFRISSAWAKRVELHPVLKRNGFDRLRTDFGVVDQIEMMMENPRLEILAKGRQWRLVEQYLMDRYHIRNYWAEIRICMRHGYIISDPSTWMDMIDSLRKLGKDTRNPHYICPGQDQVRNRARQMKREHDRWLAEIERRRRAKEEAAAEERRKKLALAEEFYIEKMRKYLDIEVISGRISLRPLQDIADFRDEGKELKHCVFANHYYDKADTLIIGARIDGKRTETIELNLKSRKIVQCRGKNNLPSAHHAEIMKLMKDNIQKYTTV